MGHTIRRKLTVTLLGLLAGALAIFLLAMNGTLRDLAVRQVRETAGVVGRNAALAIRSSLFYGDHNRLANIVEPLVLEDFAYFFVYEGSTRDFAFQQVRRGLAEAVAARVRVSAAGVQPEPEQMIEAGGDEYRQFAFPVYFGRMHTPAGQVIIGVSEKQVIRRLQVVTRRVLLGAVVALLIILVAAWATAVRISRPIAELSRAMGAFSAGDHRARAEVGSRDEIQTLAQAFNDMAQRIVEQIAAIEHYSRNLESMVEARTVSLQNALDQLHHKELELRQAEKLRGLRTLVSSIAHEINNPMTVIYGNLQMLENETRGDPGPASRFPAIHSAVDRISRLLDDIAFFSGFGEITMSPVPLGRLVGDVVAEAVPAGVEVDVDTDGDPVIPANSEMLRHCLKNILENSVQAMEGRPAPHRIRIRMEVAENAVEVQIEDNGGGFREIERIFEPFYTTQSERRGLGLTFVHHIVELHNGRVGASNTGEGARVAIQLPRTT